MAEGGESQGDHEQSAISGNDCVYDFYCEMCKDDGLNAEADGYCQDCKEYMCSICIQAHNKYRRFRNHVVLDQASMPKDSPLFGNTLATLFADIDISSSIDSHPFCNIVGSVVLPDTSLVVVDKINNCVKVVDTRSKKIKSELKLDAPSKPSDIALINDKNVAILHTTGSSNDGNVVFLRVADTLTITRKFSVRGDCYGIAISNYNILVSFACSGYIKMMDFQGENVSNAIQREAYYYHICVSKDGESLYTPGKLFPSLEDGLVHTTFGGQVKSVYRKLKDAQNLCLDHCGNVYVADGYTRTVHMVAEDCKKGKVLLTDEDGLSERVMSVSHCKRTNRLFVGMEVGIHVKVYQLS